MQGAPRGNIEKFRAPRGGILENSDVASLIIKIRYEHLGALNLTEPHLGALNSSRFHPETP
eukprot:8696271-Pyramimonas_sp.AAC.1